jgi:adenylyltransferase/sulfurtransferase
VERYSRQTLVKYIGPEGQKKLGNSRVLLVGCGGLGTNISNILVRAGVGFVRIIDRDVVELSNLQRQGLFSERDVEERLPKAIAAKRRLQQVNSEVEIEAVVEELNGDNIAKYINDVDLILDGTDNFVTRFLINQAAVKSRIPWVHGGVVATNGVVMNVFPGEGPCLKCLYPRLPGEEGLPGSEVIGILGTLTSVVGALQANEAIKYLSGNKDKMIKGILYVDLWQNTFESLSISRREDCDCCSAI